MDLIEALEAANIDYHNGRDDSEIYICCPFCTDERFRLGVNVVTGRSHCFNDGCEWKAYGDYAFRKLQEALDTGEITAQQERRKRKKRKMEQITLPEGFEKLRNADDHWMHKAYTYIRKRGISSDQIKEKQIGFTETDKHFSYRVVFPAYLNGTLVGLTGRDITGKQEPKWKNSVGSKCIYNLPEKKHSTCVLSESAIPALVIERVSRKMGIDSLGLLGHSIQDSQVDLLKHYKRVILWMDPDVAGVQGLVGTNTNSKGIYHKLKEEGKSVKVILPKGMLENDSYDERDPDEMEVKEIFKRLESPITFTDGLVLKLKTWMVFDE